MARPLSSSAPGRFLVSTTPSTLQLQVCDADSALVTFNKHGTNLIESLSLNGVVKAHTGRLVVILSDGPDEAEVIAPRPQITGLASDIDAVSVEQSGPVRAVVKVRDMTSTVRISRDFSR